MLLLIVLVFAIIAAVAGYWVWKGQTTQVNSEVSVDDTTTVISEELDATTLEEFDADFTTIDQELNNL